VDYRREHNWEQQREQLSALLDNQLGEQERAALEAHLRDCAECQAELASLQQTRALLRALPQPVLPRNFTLPLDVAVEEPPEVEPVHQIPPQPAQHPRPLRHAREQRWKRPVQVMQWLSTVAAVLGLVLLCSSAFSSVHLSMGGASNNSSSAPSAAQATSYRTPPTVRTGNTLPGDGSPVATQDTPASTPTPVPLNTTHGDSSSGISNPNNTQWFISATGLGILLLILSVCGFIVARILRRQW
jgi:negative regulator of sigma E activity